MANASAFGFSGYDPVGSYFEGSLNNYFDKKSEQRAYERQLALMEAQYSYAQRYAENTPSWTVKGLRAAGLNPILAVANGVNTAAQAPSVPSASSHRSPINSKASFNASGLLPFDRRMAKQNADSQTLAAQAADKQAAAALINARANADRASADVALKALERQRYEDGGNYDRPEVRDAHRTLNHALDSFSYTWDYLHDTFRRPYINTKGSPAFDSLINYVQHGPKSSGVDKKVYNKLESVIDDISEALPFRGFRHHLKGTSKRVRSLINTR